MSKKKIRYYGLVKCSGCDVSYKTAAPLYKDMYLCILCFIKKKLAK